MGCEDRREQPQTDYGEETRKIGERFNLWHRITESIKLSDAVRLRRLWALAGRIVERKALQNLRKGEIKK